jgi:hypothetical protein
VPALAHGEIDYIMPVLALSLQRQSREFQSDSSPRMCPRSRLC